MKHAPEQYAKAYLKLFKQASKDEKKNIARAFAKMISRNGDITQGEKIIRAIEKLAVQANGGKVVNIEFAQGVSKETEKKISELFSEKDTVSIHTNPSLIAGVRIMLDDSLELNMSMQNKLQQL